MCSTMILYSVMEQEATDIADKKLKVLFVGNSYTSRNQLPQVAFAEVAQAAGYEVEETSITRGCYRLCRFADPENEHGIRLRQAATGVHYDCAVPQEQSLIPITDEAVFLQGVEDVKALISADRFVLYATWGRNDGSEYLAALGLTREEMTEKLSAAYHKAGKLYDVRVTEADNAFYSIKRGWTYEDHIYKTRRTRHTKRAFDRAGPPAGRANGKKAAARRGG